MTKKNKTALITGGRRGIGLGIARCLAKEGLNLAICGLHKETETLPIIKELRDLGAEVLYSQVDISKKNDREKLVDTIKKHFGRLDVLVNNAGIAPAERTDILKTGEESFEKLIKVNLQGPYFLTQLVARWMIEQKKTEPVFPGCIINISSVSATIASPRRGDYCLSKAAISMATKLWATRLAEYNIPVYEIQPGLIKTDMTVPVTEKYEKLISEGLLLQARWGTPEDVGKAVAMMVRGDIAYSTGQVLVVDGGLTLRRL
ncbi:MAG: 3-ketoacyl-ACP reductase [Planctomycetes bacterium]|nr:3-ketoacyl-ACP reductase [Planctomycetota bacterium]